MKSAGYTIELYAYAIYIYMILANIGYHLLCMLTVDLVSRLQGQRNEGQFMLVQ